jgi:molybdenum cofactor synthesis domain-containing protein
MAQVSEPDGRDSVSAPGVRALKVRALAVTVSNRAAAGVYEDRSGPVLTEMLHAAGCSVVDGPLVVPDGEPVEAALRDAVAGGYDVVVTTGGTGLTPADLTPEMTRRVLDREIPGIAEALRAAGAAAGVPSAILSRGIAGTAGRTLIVNLPGSTGGVRDGMAVLAPVLGHAVSQINGGDHVRAKLPAVPAARPAAPAARRARAADLARLAWRPPRYRGMMGLWDECAAGRSP